MSIEKMSIMKDEASMSAFHLDKQCRVLGSGSETRISIISSNYALQLKCLQPKFEPSPYVDF